jgi:type III restriction enzyme
MIRTPLARRIDSDEVLNTVELFLPHYDADSLEAVLKKLRNPDEHDGVATKVITEAIEYHRDPKFEDVFEFLNGLPTYSVNRAPKLTDLKRALRLSSMLTHDGLDPDADENLRALFTSKLKELRDARAKNESEWLSMVKESGEIAVDEISITVGPMHIGGRGSSRMTLSSENIDQLFDEAGRVLASGEGLHRSYWRRYHSHEKPSEAKLEIAAVVRHADTKPALDALAKEQFHSLFEANKAKIKKLPSGERQGYQQLQLASGKAEAHEWELPEYISEKPGDDMWDDHLFIDDKGKFSATLNTWEKEFLEWAKQKPGFVGWLRNMERRPWAFCVPYELGTEKPFFPDFAIIRKKGKTYEVDLLEPHDDTRTDTWAKAKGLAKFADAHGMEFGGLYVGRKKDGKLQVVNVADQGTREKARRMQSANDVEGLFASA